MAAFIVSTIVCLTDMIDGRLARKLGQETYLGSLIDPVADKTFELGLMYFLWVKDLVPTEYLILFYFRNIIQLMSFPILMWWKKIEFKVKPVLMSKLASAWGMILINLLILNFTLNVNIFFVVALLIISALFEIYMVITYVPRFIAIYKGKQDTFV